MKITDKRLAKVPVLFLLTFAPLCGQVVLSEIMFNMGNPNEFVEIYNLSTDTVDLDGWIVKDIREPDNLIDAGSGMRLVPHSYAVIFEGDYDLKAGVYSSIFPDTVLALKVDSKTIGNQLTTTDTLFLISGNGDTADSVGWKNVTIAGFSLERIRLDRPSKESNWATSDDSLGTPGFTNSVAPLDIDAAIVPESVSHSPQFPSPDDPISLQVTISNDGNTTINGTVEVAEDNEVLGAVEFSELVPLDSIVVQANISGLSSGVHMLDLFVNVQSDMDLKNNSAEHAVAVRYVERVLTVNEFLYAPDTEVPEFIEFVNVSLNSLSLLGWGFSDRDTSTVRRFPSYEIPAQGYLVSSKDSSLAAFMPVESVLLVPENGFPSLNNSGDTIYLFDPTGNIVDSLTYSSDWGGGDGRSVEKINPSLDSRLRSNWGTCVAEEKMTPGRQNSIFFESLSVSASIALDPNPFSPDGDDFQDELRISYRLPFARAYLTVLIFDSVGRQVRTVAKNLATGSEGILTWDGRTNANKRARIGVYIIKIIAVEVGTNSNMEWIKTAVLAERLR